MTENEVKAIRWMKCVKDDAVVTLDHIAKSEPNVRPTLYAGRKEKAETIINGFDELEQYRAIGTIEECREAMERQRAKKPVEYEDKYYGCPVCDNVLLHKWERYPVTFVDKRNGLPYCLSCGQAIDWSE